jgi:hypothetical protein
MNAVEAGQRATMAAPTRRAHQKRGEPAANPSPDGAIEA